MKTTILSICLILCISAFSQETNTILPKNEIGVDVSNLLSDIIGTTNSSNTKYYLSYRRMIGSGNLRFGAGAFFNSSKNPNVVESNFQSYNFRIGYEKLIDVSSNKQWQLYLGLDFRPSFQSSNNIINRNSIEETDCNAQNFLGLAPLAGMRYNINDKLSATIEGNLLYNYVLVNNSKKTTDIQNGTSVKTEELSLY